MRDPNRPLRGARVAILVADGFEQSDLSDAREALVAAGARCDLISPSPGRVLGFQGGRHGDLFAVDASVEEAQASDYDALMLPGGEEGRARLRAHPVCARLLAAIDQAGKPLAMMGRGASLSADAVRPLEPSLGADAPASPQRSRVGARRAPPELAGDGSWVCALPGSDRAAFHKAAIESCELWLRERELQEALAFTNLSEAV